MNYVALAIVLSPYYVMVAILVYSVIKHYKKKIPEAVVKKIGVVA